MAHVAQQARAMAPDEALVKLAERARSGVLALSERKHWCASAPSLALERVWCDSVWDGVPDGES